MSYNIQGDDYERDVIAGNSDPNAIARLQNQIEEKITGKIGAAASIDANSEMDEGISVLWCGNGSSNLPTGETSGILLVFTSDVVGVQIFVNNANNTNQKIYYRNRWGSGWRTWQKISSATA